MSWRAPGLGWLLVGASLAGVSAPAAAQTGAGDTTEKAQQIPSGDGDAGLSMEFLEFLGEWESGDGEWVGPAEVQSEDWPVIASEPSETNGAGDEN